MNEMIKKINVVKKIFLVLAVIAFLFGAVTSYHAGKERNFAREAKNIEVLVMDKSNANTYNSSLKFNFSVFIKNNAKLTVEHIVGDMKVLDADGKLLTSGEASFSGEIKPKSESAFTLSWDTDITDSTVKLWDSDIKQLSVSFQITEIQFEGSNDLIKVDCAPVIKPYDEETLAAIEKSYQEALALYAQQKYAEAAKIFESLGKYKESYDYYLESGSKSEASAIEATYAEAMILFADGKYGEAIAKLYEIEEQYYVDYSDKIAELTKEAEKKADALAESGDYVGATDILAQLGYDEYPYDTMYQAYYYASQNDFAKATEYGLTVAVIPEGVETIPDGYFEYAENLQKVILPSTIKTIGNTAFKGCRMLKEINLPDGLIFIGKSAFESCIKLISIQIPDSVLTIGDSAFRSCSGISNITLPTALQSIGAHAFAGCSFTKITLPDTLISIGKGSFSGCSSLLSISIPESVKTISESAFNNCTKLANVSISDGVEVIGELAFGTCSMLTVINLPGTLKEIGNRAFDKCTSLSKITISANVEKIGSNAFLDCGALVNVYFDNTTGWKIDGRKVTVTDSRENALNLTTKHNSIWTRTVN